MTTTATRLAGTCALLSGVTLLSWWLGLNDGRHVFTLDAGITLGVILIAALKVRVIAWEFMELRHAPPGLRRIADAVLAAVMLLLIALYFLGTKTQA